MELLVLLYILEPALRCTSIVIIETNLSRDTDLRPDKEKRLEKQDIFLTLPQDDIIAVAIR